MRFTLSSTLLSTKLTALSKVINNKSSMPILADFVFDISGTKLSLTASDGETTMTTAMELTGSDGDGIFAVGNHNLLEAVKGFAEQPLTFDVDLTTHIAKIIYQNGQLSMPVDSADEFPQAQCPAASATVLTVSNALLAENVSRSLFATAQEELRPVMNGLYFDLTPESLSIVATDGHKLVRNRLFAITAEEPSSFILPKKPATLLKALLPKDEEITTITYDEHNAEIAFADITIVCRLIEGRYPSYNSVIPQNNPNKMVVDRMALMSALKRVVPFANDSSNLIRFHVENNTLQLDAEDFDFSKTATERMACDYGGQPMSIGFKGTSFLEVLQAFDCQDVAVQLADPTRAGLVLPSEQDDKQDVVMLLMPMLIN